MIEIKAVTISPQTVNTGQSFKITVDAVEKISIFKFPLVIDKLTKLIFKKN